MTTEKKAKLLITPELFEETDWGYSSIIDERNKCPPSFEQVTDYLLIKFPHIVGTFSNKEKQENTLNEVETKDVYHRMFFYINIQDQERKIGLYHQKIRPIIPSVILDDVISALYYSNDREVIDKLLIPIQLKCQATPFHILNEYMENVIDINYTDQDLKDDTKIVPDSSSLSANDILHIFVKYWVYDEDIYGYNYESEIIYGQMIKGCIFKLVKNDDKKISILYAKSWKDMIKDMDEDDLNRLKNELIEDNSEEVVEKILR